jgi:septal ring factor EnvC (AmiA/AmiB activator)
MEIQPRADTKKVEEIERRKKPAIQTRQPMLENPMMRRVMRVGGLVLPHLVWLVPLIDRFAPRRDSVGPSLRALSTDLRNDLRNELNHHMAEIKAAQAEANPAIEEQQQRLDKLEEHASELNHSLTNLSEDQLDLADQVRAMAGWVRNSAIAGLGLLVLFFILKVVQTFHH